MSVRLLSSPRQLSELAAASIATLAHIRVYQRTSCTCTVDNLRGVNGVFLTHNCHSLIVKVKTKSCVLVFAGIYVYHKYISS